MTPGVLERQRHLVGLLQPRPHCQGVGCAAHQAGDGLLAGPHAGHLLCRLAPHPPRHARIRYICALLLHKEAKGPYACWLGAAAAATQSFAETVHVHTNKPLCPHAIAVKQVLRQQLRDSETWLCLCWVMWHSQTMPRHASVGYLLVATNYACFFACVLIVPLSLYVCVCLTLCPAAV